jgi:sterol desaturase/sphingolipid hydroxylase (fatty acid hydroxylase superfamily)
MDDAFRSGLATVGGILAAMAIVALVESAIPLRPRGRWSAAHLRPNLALTFTTFATNLCFNALLVGLLVSMETHDVGVLRLLALPAGIAAALAVVALDFSTYVAHVAMHSAPVLWRFHQVHHADPTVDVTTTIRQHPGESVIRYAFMAGCGAVLGASPGAFAVYRVWSALQGLVEHANVRLPLGVDRALSFVVPTPNMHKVHHSRAAAQTNSNYGNLFSLFDLAFGTFTPSIQGVDVEYGLDGYDDPAVQTTGGLLALPFREPVVSPAAR